MSSSISNEVDRYGAFFYIVQLLKNDGCFNVVKPCNFMSYCELCIFDRLILSSGDAQNKEMRSFAQGMLMKISDMMAKAKV